MEILLTLAYVFLVRMIFFDYRWLPWNLFTGILVWGLYVGAALTEIVLLGQYTPYSDRVFVERPVIQMATYLGGQVEEVYVKPHQQVAKGTPLYKMDPAPIQASLDNARGVLAKAKQELEDTQKLVDRKVMAAEALKIKQDEVNAAQGEVDVYMYRLQQTVARAPADGYVLNLQLRAGQFVRLKAPVMSFVSSEEAFLIMAVRQEGSQYIEPGQEIEFALTMYPGQVFTTKVGALVKGAGEAQLEIGGLIPHISSIKEIGYFAVQVKLDEQQLGAPMIFGASGIAAINTGQGADVFWLLRRIEIQSESLLNYVYNPFRG
ncbi:MAG: efflux RND transporter periplasmic adaptor subunit [Halieaceae bacterium]